MDAERRDSGPGRAPRLAVLATLIALSGAAVCLLRTPAPAPEPPSPATSPSGAREGIARASAATTADLPALRRDALGDAPLLAAHAVRALGRLGALTGDDAVLARLQNGPTRVRQEILLALGASGDAGQIPRVAACVHDADPHVRRLALVALGRLDARAVLAGVLTDPNTDPIDRIFARDALQPPATPPLLASTGAAAPRE